LCWMSPMSPARRCAGRAPWPEQTTDFRRCAKEGTARQEGRRTLQRDTRIVPVQFERRSSNTNTFLRQSAGGCCARMPRAAPCGFFAALAAIAMRCIAVREPTASRLNVARVAPATRLCVRYSTVAAATTTPGGEQRTALSCQDERRACAL
jgi:hypothetical protein